mgnify:CR=1 FL=1
MWVWHATGQCRADIVNEMLDVALVRTETENTHATDIAASGDGAGDHHAHLAVSHELVHFGDDFSGQVEKREPYALLARAKLLVMTSKSEGLPNTLIESLIVGVPAIALDCPHGPKEIIGPVGADALIAQERLDLLPERIERFVAAPYPIPEPAVARFRREHVLEQIERLGGPPD